MLALDVDLNVDYYVVDAYINPTMNLREGMLVFPPLIIEACNGKIHVRRSNMCIWLWIQQKLSSSRTP